MRSAPIDHAVTRLRDSTGSAYKKHLTHSQEADFMSDW